MAGIGEIMTLDTIQELLARQPFEPFQIVASSGDRYPVFHPEMVLRVKNGVYVGLGGRRGVAERAAFISLLHVAAVKTVVESPSRSRHRQN